MTPFVVRIIPLVVCYVCIGLPQVSFDIGM